MEKIFELLVKKIIFKKYPYLKKVNVRDMFEDVDRMESFKGTSYQCLLDTEECLSSKLQMEIDKEIKTLFSMVGFERKDGHKSPTISCMFNCGDGYEFHSTPGYNH
jgi:hypothetical protein